MSLNSASHTRVTNSKLVLSAFWESRPETREACAMRLADFLSKATQWPKPLNGWGKKDGYFAKHKPGLSLTGNRGSLIADLFESVDGQSSSHHQLGFSITLWNLHRKPTEVGFINIHCGSGPCGAMEYPNRLFVRFPVNCGFLREVSVVQAMVGSLMSSWEPSWGALMRERIYDEYSGFDAIKHLDYVAYYNAIRYKSVKSITIGTEQLPLLFGGAMLYINSFVSNNREPLGTFSDTAHVVDLSETLSKI